MLKLGCILLIMSHLVSCRSTRTDDTELGQWQDYGLEDVGPNQGSATPVSKGHYHFPTGSSLPQAVKCGRKGRALTTLPAAAKPGYRSQYLVNLRGCGFILETTGIRLDRFLWTNQWVPFGQTLASGGTIKLRKGMHLNLQIATELKPRFTKESWSRCRRYYIGRKTFLGKFHLNRSQMALAAGQLSPKNRFHIRKEFQQSVGVFLNWPVHSKMPVLEDELGLAPSLKSPIFRARFTQDGYYHIAAAPIVSREGDDLSWQVEPELKIY